MRLLLILLLGSGLLLFAACDDDPTINPADVAGEFGFTVYRFDLQNGGFAPDANVLDSLNTTRTNLQLFQNNRFFLEYRFKDETSSSLLIGTFTLGENDVLLQFEKGSEAELQQLLLPDEVRFSIRENGNLLIASQRREGIRLDHFDPRYGTFRYDGILRIEAGLQGHTRRVDAVRHPLVSGEPVRHGPVPTVDRPAVRSHARAHRGSPLRDEGRMP